MTDFIDLPPQQMPGADFICQCGLKHKVDLKRIIIESDAIKAIPEILSEYMGKGRIQMVSDSNTYPIAGKKIYEMLTNKGFDIRSFIFETSAHQLNPDEKTLGRLFYELEPTVAVILAVGSGVINDISRTSAFRIGKRHIIIGTAPSMDGYASSSSPLVIDGFKLSSYDAYPDAIICDTSYMKEAPMIMIQAGFGDIIGKITSLTDWKLSSIINGEHHCSICSGMMELAVKKCIDNISGIKAREEYSIRLMTEALVSAGIAMGIYTSTRPASCTEHYFAHYWDMAAIKKGVEHPLHGNSVAVGTVVTCDAYKYMEKYLPQGFDYPETSYIKSLFKELGCPVIPDQIGISKELFTESVIHCIDGRIKYGILNLAKDNGILEELAIHLTKIYY